jgi:hypothetical protein
MKTYTEFMNEATHIEELLQTLGRGDIVKFLVQSQSPTALDISAWGDAALHDTEESTARNFGFDSVVAFHEFARDVVKNSKLLAAALSK